MIAVARDLGPETTPPANDARRSRHRRLAAALLPARSEQRLARPVAPWKAWLLTGWIVLITGYYLWTLAEALSAR